MCEDCDEVDRRVVIHHEWGKRPIHREHCFCSCHDWRDEAGHHRSGVARDNEAAAHAACADCRWAHAVAFSTRDWRRDEANMRPRLTPPGAAAGGDA